ncbi:MAG TPA: glycosyltransferase family 9 protein [Ktedonobacteraceae bacterium]|nr:glycosyltransferase family 9 protein [Ktedonobacteraceae bacterium]
MKHTHIFVIRPGAIGDVLLTLPVLRALREAHANPHITLVSNAVVLPLALASRIVDEGLDYQESRWSELFSDAGIRSPAVRGLLAHTNLAICWLRDPDSIVERNVREAGVQRVIVAPGRPPEGAHVHIVEYLGATVGVHPLPDAFVKIHHRSTPNNTIAIHPGSGGVAKCWPLEKFVEVIKRLWQQNRSVLLLAGPADEKRLERMLEQLPSEPKRELLQVLENRPLLEVAQRLQACQCYLGNDSGITHLAAMLGVPTIALFGPSDPAVWRPVGPLVSIIREQPLERLPVDVVMGAIKLFP